MNGYNFTDRVRRVLQMAREEAARLRHEYVGTEHLLLGIIRDGDGAAATVLKNLHIHLDQTRRHIEQTVKRGKAARTVNRDLPYTLRAKKVLEFAMSEARELHHSYVGTEHLLLGLLREEQGIAAQALFDASLTLESTRKEVLRFLGSDALGEAREEVFFEDDQRLKTAIALIELHRIRFGSYPDSLDHLQFLGGSDRAALTNLMYERLPNGYALDIVTGHGTRPRLTYPSDFWRGLGLRRSNVRPAEDT
jgi:hypothetical protein